MGLNGRTLLRNITITLGSAFVVAFAFGRIVGGLIEDKSPASAAPLTAAAPEVERQPPKSPTPTPTPPRMNAPRRTKTFTATTRSAPVRTRNWQGLRISGGTVRVSRAQFNHLTTKGLQPILQTARVEPVIEGDKILGFGLRKIAPGSLWEAAGYQKNDLFKSVNGVPLSNVPQAIKVLQTMKRASNIRIEYVRHGQTRYQTILIQ